MKRSHSQLPLFILEARSRVLGGGRQLYAILLLMAAVASLSGFFLTHPIHPSAAGGLARRQIDLPGKGVRVLRLRGGRGFRKRPH